METKLWTGLHINTLVSSESALHGQNMHSNRENMQGGEKTQLWRKLFAEIIHFPPFLCFPYADSIPLPFPSLFLSLSLFSSCTFHSILHISDSPPSTIPHHFLTQLAPPQFSLFVFLFRHLIPALPSLPDIVARCPMSHTSAKIIRDGGRGEGAKERNRQGERKSRREWQREKYRK